MNSCRVALFMFPLFNTLSTQAAVYMERCLAALGVGDTPGSGMPEGVEIRGLLLGMRRALDSKLAPGRIAAERALLRCLHSKESTLFRPDVVEEQGQGSLNMEGRQLTTSPR